MYPADTRRFTALYNFFVDMNGMISFSFAIETKTVLGTCLTRHPLNFSLYIPVQRIRIISEYTAAASKPTSFAIFSS